MLQNLVDLGTNVGTNVVLSPEEFFPTNRPARRMDTNGPPPDFGPGGGPPPPDRERDNEARPQANADTNLSAAISAGLTNMRGSSTNSENRRRGRRRGDPERPFQRPSWMSQEEYQTILQKKGVHGFTIVMSTQSLAPLIVEDIWLRGIIILLGTMAVAGYALAWRNADKTRLPDTAGASVSELESVPEGNESAAAGLAHETRNPLNIVRGLAQMISRREDASTEIREKSKQMIEETDRVTAQLNEFINFSRPREVARGDEPEFRGGRSRAGAELRFGREKGQTSGQCRAADD